MVTFSSSVHAGLHIHCVPQALGSPGVDGQKLTYIESGVHCGGCVQIPDDTFQGTSGREIGEERRVLPMRNTGHDEILEIICDIFDILPLGRWCSLNPEGQNFVWTQAVMTYRAARFADSLALRLA